VRGEIRQLQRKLGLTAVMVTHDQEEALAMADPARRHERRRDPAGRDQRELYNRPSNRFVASFIGRSNVFDGSLAGDASFRTSGGSTSPAPAPPPAAARSWCVPRRSARRRGKRPQQLSRDARAGTYLGPLTEYAVRLAGGESVTVHAATRAGQRSRALRLRHASASRMGPRILPASDLTGTANERQQGDKR